MRGNPVLGEQKYSFLYFNPFQINTFQINNFQINTFEIKTFQINTFQINTFVSLNCSERIPFSNVMSLKSVKFKS